VFIDSGGVFEVAARDRLSTKPMNPHWTASNPQMTCSSSNYTTAYLAEVLDAQNKANGIKNI
jgi:hypothetical protein